MAGSHRETFTRRPLIRTGSTGSGASNHTKTPIAPVSLASRADAFFGSNAQYGDDANITGHDLAARVAQSIAAIERAADDAAGLRENLQFYKDLAEELTQQIDEDEQDKRELKRNLADAQRSVLAEQARAAEANRHVAEREATIRHLEDQIQTLQSQTERLVDAAMRILTKDGFLGSEAGGRNKLAA